jgi:putative transposase
VLKVPRSSVYYRAKARVPRIDEVMAQRIKHLIEQEPYLGYRMIWARLRNDGIVVNPKTIQRIMQLRRWQCHRRQRRRCGPRVETSISSSLVSNVRWATDATYVWTQLEGLVYVNAVIDCADREVIGLNVSQRNDAREAVYALEDACLRRFSVLPTQNTGVTIRSDNALVFASKLYRDQVKAYGLAQEFILPHTPEQNGIAESFMGTLKLECIWQQRFQTFAEASDAIYAYVRHYNHIRPHSSLQYLTPVAWRQRQEAEITSLAVQ